MIRGGTRGRLGFVRCKKRAQIRPDSAKRQNKALRDKQDKVVRIEAVFTYKNNKFPTQTAYFRPASHGTNIAD